jgi:molybdopterin-synthase adenylyltransferase
VRPRLKGAVWERDRDQLRLVHDVRNQFTIRDPQGTVELLLELLREGRRTVEQLLAEFTARGWVVSAADVTEAVRLLDSYRLLEDDDRPDRLAPAGRERLLPNLAFFEPFARLERSRGDFQRAVQDAHVLLLGIGALNSHTIPHLCGLGVGRLTLLDRGAVESGDLARQHLYRHCDLGGRKVRVAADWVRAFDPGIAVEALDAAVAGPEDVAELAERLSPDVVVSGMDSEVGVGDWVNAGCVARRVPYVWGGMHVAYGFVYSVDPGVSGCRACAVAASPPRRGNTTSDAATLDLLSREPRTDRGIGPAAGLLGALSAFEVLRYLTRFEPPQYAGQPALIDFAGGCVMTRTPAWPRYPDCAVCGANATVDTAA